MVESWRISKSKDLCCRCGRQFPVNRVFFSCLVEEPTDLARRDLCPDCWEHGVPENLFCYWRTRRAPGQQKQVVDSRLMLEFFDRLEQADAERKRVFRFVLALYLMRRKELKLLQVSRGEAGESLLCERRGSGEKVEVANPGLTEEQIQETAAQLGQLLNACL